MSWLEVCVKARDAREAEAVAEVLQLFALGDEGVVLEQLGNPDDLDPRAMLPETLVKLVVIDGRGSAEFRAKLQNKLTANQLPQAIFTPIEEQDWATAWRDNYQPLPIGNRFWIWPSWVPVEGVSEDALVLVLDPGMAFGTGTHPTTQLCLMLLEERIRPNMSLLDLGCGSGILSIGASKLGACPIISVDTDEIAISSTEYNAQLNQCHNQIDIIHGSLGDAPQQKWDIVVANILAPILITLLEQDGLLDTVKADGYLILSGILEQQTAAITAVVEKLGGDVVEILQQEEWVALLVKHRSRTFRKIPTS